jgi:Cyclic nucleotide-binding domain
MKRKSSILSVSWIPSEAIEGSMRVPFDVGVAHYDAPPPDEIPNKTALEKLRKEDRYRFANRLSAWIEVEDGKVVDAGYDGGSSMGATTMKIGRMARTFEAIGLPDIQRNIKRTATSATFEQTCGGRTGVPAPRRVRRKPFIQWQAPLVWTTLQLTLHADGRAEGEMIGHSRFPRHWVYDNAGALSHKSGLADFKDWYRVSFGRHTPWGDTDSRAVVTAVESALERTLSEQVMRGNQKPTIRTIKEGKTLVKQGDPGDEIFLLLDGVLRVDHDGERLAEYGPGALLGERAHLEDGGRTSTLVAITKCRVACVAPSQLDRKALVELSAGHRREDARKKA